MLTQARVRELFKYEPDSGALYRGDRRIGHRHSKSCGHLAVSVDGKNYLVHRIIWLYVTGAWPQQSIDHKNGDGADNRWENLREASGAINAQNLRRAKRNSKTGLLGACLHSQGKYVAQITVNRKVRVLGHFATAEEAHVVYLRAKRQLHEGCTI